MDTLTPFRRYFRYAALACSVASALLTWMFGVNQSEYWLVGLACAMFLVACSLASDYINLFVVDAWRAKNWGMFGTFAIGAAFVFSLNLLSNLGSVGWQRDAVSTAASVQNTKYEDARANVDDNATNLALWRKQLAALKAANAWAGTVTADGLRAQVESLKAAEVSETRLGGCGPKCRAIQNQIIETQGKIAVAEQESDLSRRIEATQRILDKHRVASANTETKVAAPVSQAKFFASMATVSLAPTADAQTWTDRGIASWLALGLCIAPILFGLIGWKSDSPSHSSTGPVSGSLGTRTPDLEPSRASPLPSGILSEPIVVHTVETIKDETLRRWALSDEVRAMLGGNGQIKAA
jgi:hypothetical protein